MRKHNKDLIIWLAFLACCCLIEAAKTAIIDNN